MTTRKAVEYDAARKQVLTEMKADGVPDFSEVGGEAVAVAPSLDPQWMNAWKMFLDRDDKEYGVPVRVPIGQYFGRTPSHLENVRRPDGGFWFQISTPARVQPEPKFECFVGECRKKLQQRIQLVNHVRAFHVSEAQAYAAILTQIEQKVAQEDPRLQRLLASLDDDKPEFVANDEPVVVTCAECGEASPVEHVNPANWLRGHRLGAHKVEAAT